MSVVKEEVSSLLERLPEDASVEDLQYQLYVVEKVRHGLDAARSEGTQTQHEAEDKLGAILDI